MVYMFVNYTSYYNQSMLGCVEVSFIYTHINNTLAVLLKV